MHFLFLLLSVCVYGGGNRREQVKTVTEGVDIVIATPGRLNDLVMGGELRVYIYELLYLLINEMLFANPKNDSFQVT